VVQASGARSTRRPSWDFDTVVWNVCPQIYSAILTSSETDTCSVSPVASPDPWSAAQDISALTLCVAPELLQCHQLQLLPLTHKHFQTLHEPWQLPPNTTGMTGDAHRAFYQEFTKPSKFSIKATELLDKRAARGTPTLLPSWPVRKEPGPGCRVTAGAIGLQPGSCGEAEAIRTFPLAGASRSRPLPPSETLDHLRHCVGSLDTSVGNQTPLVVPRTSGLAPRRWLSPCLRPYCPFSEHADVTDAVDELFQTHPSASRTPGSARAHTSTDLQTLNLAMHRTSFADSLFA